MAKTNTMNCDLLVIGGGGSGLIAAVKAAEISGKKVLIIEKAKKPGGCAYFAHGFQTENSKWQKEAGYPDTSDNSFLQTMRHLNWNVNPKIIRNYVDASGPFFDWLVEKGGAEEYFIKPEKASGQKDEPPQGMMGMMKGRIEFPKRHMNTESRDPSIGPGWMGSYVVTKMLEQCKKLGIEVLTSTRARKFITNSNGNVTGVSADTKDGKLQVRCKACVIAAGGFGASKEKLKKRWPEYCNGNNIHIFSVPTNVGDSLDMAEKIGAFVDYKNLYWQIGGPVHHPYSYTIFRLMMQPEMVYVNLNGERFMSETDFMMGGVNALTKQPRSEMYGIVDSDLAEMMGERLIANPFDGPTDVPIQKKFREDIAYEVSLDEGGAKGNHTKKADTLEELAKKIGAKPQTLVATIKRYNEFCDNGRDLDFAKKPDALKQIIKPPFYAFFGQRFSETTHGGIVINENMEVLSTKNKVIPGLFAAGDNTGGMVTDGAGPSELGWAVRSGYMAGIAAAKYLK